VSFVRVLFLIVIVKKKWKSLHKASREVSLEGSRKLIGSLEILSAKGRLKLERPLEGYRKPQEGSKESLRAFSVALNGYSYGWLVFYKHWRPQYSALWQPFHAYTLV
jgi:hypothetical protein